MTSLAGAWDGIGSSIVGGLIGAFTVALGAWIAYRLSEKARRRQLARDDLRRARVERRTAAADLMVAVSNARDDVCSRSNGLTGRPSLYPLRNTLFTAHVPLHAYPSYWEVKAFYDVAGGYRDWIRARHPRDEGPDWTERHFPIVTAFRKDLWNYGDWIIGLLQDHLEEDPQQGTRPTLGTLPDA